MTQEFNDPCLVAGCKLKNCLDGELWCAAHERYVMRRWEINKERARLAALRPQTPKPDNSPPVLMWQKHILGLPQSTPDEDVPLYRY